MKNISKLGQEFGQYRIQLTSELFLRTGQPRSLSEMERNIWTMLLKVGQFLLSSWIALQESSPAIEAVGCPHCGAQAQYRCKREGRLLTILGQVSYKRAYYLCPACQQGHYPLDHQLPFGQGSQLFEALTLISVSDHSLAKATQAVGEEVRALELEWVAQSRDGDLDAVSAAFERLTDHARASEPATKAATYFTNNRQRMDYPAYRAKGYQIGSGTIESGCK